MSRLFRLCLYLLIFAFVPITVSAQIPEPLRQGLSPLEGAILMPLGGEWLVDLDAARGLRQGDLLAVLTPGERIVDPQTRDVIGRVDDVSGYIEVTRVLSGYSYVRPVTPGLALQLGDRVRRFDRLPALIEPSVPGDLSNDLQAAFSHLRWVESLPADVVAALRFSLEDERLLVTTASGEVLHSYRRSAQGFAPVVATPSLTVPGTPKSERSLLNRSADALLGTVGLSGLTGDRRLEAPSVARRLDTDGVWMSSPLGDNPIGVAAGDLTGDGRLEIIIALTHDLRIMRMEDGQLIAAGRVDFPAGTQLLGIDVLDLDGDGRDELYITAVSGRDLRSQVVEYRNGRFERVITMVSWFLRAVDLADHSRILVGQSLNSGDNPFAGTVFRVERRGDELVRGADLPLPSGASLFSVLPLAGLSAGAPYALITTDDSLQVVSGGHTLWRAGEHFGGSDTAFESREVTGDMAGQVTVQQRLLRLPGGEILTIQNQGPRLLQRLRTFLDSQLVAFDWTGAMLQERWRTPLQKGYIADVALADLDGDGKPELLIAMRFQEKNILQRGHSVLVIYDLK